MAPTRSALLTAAALVLAGAACSGGGGDSKSSTKVTTAQGVVQVSHAGYKPERIEVPVGKEVVWSVENGSHTVVADDFSFSSPIMGSGEFRHTFSAPGTYNYHCAIIPKMHGTVVVTG